MQVSSSNPCEGQCELLPCMEPLKGEVYLAQWGAPVHPPGASRQTCGSWLKLPVEDLGLFFARSSNQARGVSWWISHLLRVDEAFCFHTSICPLIPSASKPHPRHSQALRKRSRRPWQLLGGKGRFSSAGGGEDLGRRNPPTAPGRSEPLLAGSETGAATRGDGKSPRPPPPPVP